MSYEEIQSLSRYYGHFNNIQKLSEDFAQFLSNSDLSDIVFLIDGTQFRAHKIILAARSEYFRALLFGGLKESSEKQISLTGIDPQAFNAILKYFYTGVFDLQNTDLRIVLQVLRTSHEWQINDLIDAICKYLQSILSIETVTVVLNSANLLDLEPLIEACQDFCDSHIDYYMNHHNFLNLSTKSVCGLIKRTSFYAQEEYIFEAILRWANDMPVEDLNAVLQFVRFPLMNPIYLLSNVAESGVVSQKCIIDAALAQQMDSQIELEHRGCLIPIKNMALLERGARVVNGKRNACLNGDFSSQSQDCYTYHNARSNIIISLKEAYILNTINLLLWEDEDNNGYYYYLEVSVDGKYWSRIIDMSGELSRNWQYILFPQRPIKYIKFYGLNSMSNQGNLVHIDVCFKKSK